MKERSFLDTIFARTQMPEDVTVGPGDDLAVVHPPAGRLVFGVDTVVEGVDFVTLGTEGAPEPRLIGRKAVCVNLSDIAAMGARPLWMTASAALRKGSPGDTAEGIYQGLIEAQEKFSITLVGGDMSATSGPTVLTVSVIGALEGPPLLRSGAGAGDRLCVTGDLGGSILGRHLTFTPRLAEGRYLAASQAVTSCIDISDGLATDARHIAKASNAVIEVDASAIPISDDAEKLAAREGKTPLMHALTDGEDFELLFTVRADAVDALLNPQALDAKVSVIGIVKSPAENETAGDIYLLSGDDRELLADEGYEHEV